jgi:hypothetical protein
MYSVPSATLNQIAATQDLRNKWAKNLFRLTEDQKQLQLDKQVDALIKAGNSWAVAMGYVTVAFLMVENEAISKFIQETEQSDLRAVLPEIVTPEEALLVAEKDFPMTKRDRKKLYSILLRLR